MLDDKKSAMKLTERKMMTFVIKKTIQMFTEQGGPPSDILLLVLNLDQA